MNNDTSQPQARTTVRTRINKSKVMINPYSKFSKSARALSAEFHRKITDAIINGTVKVNEDVTCVNWGLPLFNWEVTGIHTLNRVEAISNVTDKVRFFNLMSQNTEVNIPEYTNDKDVALDWVLNGHLVMKRRSTGYGGTDIIFIEDKDSLAFVMGGRPKMSKNDFFSKYIKKKDEYRIHVFKDKVIDAQRKALRKTTEDGTPVDPNFIDFRVRNHQNGFVFVRESCNPKQCVLDQAILAVQASGLDFGAVDVIYNESMDKAFVLEINTAPGLEGQTLDSYTKAITRYVEGNS